MNHPVSKDRQPVVLLGASNLTLGWNPLLSALQATVPGPLDIRVSLGMGRSYVGWSRFWVRRLPGIVECGLWENLPQADSKPPLVLMTDLGNDIVYSHTPEKIHTVARQCIQRIHEWRSDARIVMTGLPLSSIKSMGRVRFIIARSLLFPGCRMSFDEILKRSLALEQMAEELAAEHQIPYVKPLSEWYRADPIHVIRQFREPAFRRFFSNWNLEPASPSGRAESSTPRLPVTAQQTLCGLRRNVRQPVYESPQLVVSAW